MWTSRIDKLADGRAQRVTIALATTPLSYAQVLTSWQDDADFRAFFSGLLAEAPFSSFRWETPPVTKATVTRPFECVVLDSPGLARNPDVAAFAEHFREAKSELVVAFPNLGRDATMVVPCPLGPATAYGHIGAFVRLAPEAQKHALWQLLGATMHRRLSEKPVWLSTAGAGVSWLHVRLDDRAKYYGYQPYRCDESGVG